MEAPTKKSCLRTACLLLALFIFAISIGAPILILLFLQIQNPHIIFYFFASISLIFLGAWVLLGTKKGDTVSLICRLGICAGFVIEILIWWLRIF